ncbi:MAG TPA: ACT domain-containing protein [Armatimonadota bacterium]|jgi:[protein-PII] uridylyltransferase
MADPYHDPTSEDPTVALVDLLVRGREDVRARHEQGASGIEVTRRLSDLVDRLIASMFRLSLDRQTLPHGHDAEITIAATGGYGRRRLAPFSDIDVTFIVSEEDDPWLDGVAKEMFFLISSVFTDGAGLKVGYAYRTLRDLEDIDTQTQTALLDARWVAGDRPLFYRFREELIRNIRPAVFVWHKMEERHEALKQYGDSVYLVEPNVKLGAGGLRDLHTAEWLAKATMGTGLEDPWGRLRTIGLIAEDEFHAITAGREFLLRVRNGLHWVAGKPLDALTQDRQGPLAEQLGYEPTESRSAVELMMCDYYTHAATIQRVSRKVAAKSMKHPLRLDHGLVIKGGQITPTDLTLLEKEPSAALRILHLNQLYGFPLSPETEEMIGDYATRNDAPLDDPDSRRLFLQILRHPASIYATLRQMADMEVLPRVIPAYESMLRLLPAETIHNHTVGEHSLRVVRELEKMRDTRDVEHMLYQELFNSLDRPEVLHLAAMLHDAGKVRRSGNHAEVGAQMAENIGYQLGLDEDGVELLSFLVQNHGLMPHLCRTRDPQQPETVAELVGNLPRPEFLAPLYLLSCADLRTFGADTWIHVQIEFLTRLLLKAEQAMAQPESAFPSPERIQSSVKRVQRQLNLRNLPEEDVRAFCRDMPASYLLNTDLDRIVRHIQAMAKLESGPVVDFHEERRRPWTIITVAVDDAPGVLANIAGVLYAHDINVHAARVFTREGVRPVALDELLVEAHNRPLAPAIETELERDLLAVLSGQTPLSAILSRRGKEMGPGTPVRLVRLHNDMSDTFTVVEVGMPDEKGLLYRLAAAMSSLNWVIHNARIGTRAGEARDVFYITDQHGQKLEAQDVDLHVALSDGLAAGPPAD